MQPNNEKITQIINDATETLMRQVLPELIAAGATPDQVVTAARAVGIFKQAREEMVAAFPAGLVATPLRSTEDLVQKDLQEQYIELAKEYDEQAQLWEADYNRLLGENQALLEQLQASLTPHNGYSTKPEEDEELSPREAARAHPKQSPSLGRENWIWNDGKREALSNVNPIPVQQCFSCSPQYGMDSSRCWKSEVGSRKSEVGSWRSGKSAIAGVKNRVKRFLARPGIQKAMSRVGHGLGTGVGMVKGAAGAVRRKAGFKRVHELAEFRRRRRFRPRHPWFYGKERIPGKQEEKVMPINISMEITGVSFEDFSDRLNEISDALDDLSPISRELAEVVRDKHLNPLFLSEPSTLTGGVVYGGAYHAPLSRYTLTLHPERARGQIHIATGKLWRGAVQEGGGGNTYDVEGNEFVYELTDPRAPDLQEKYNRPILYWHEELEQEIAKTVLAYLVKQWNGGK